MRTKRVIKTRLKPLGRVEAKNVIKVIEDRIVSGKITVLTIAGGMRRDDEVYNTATKRVSGSAKRIVNTDPQRHVHDGLNTVVGGGGFFDPIWEYPLFGTNERAVSSGNFINQEYIL
jgi:hypothetical protein